MHGLLQDFHYAVRQLRKSPGFAVTAILTLAIGIGANTGLFSVMDAVVLRPLAVPDLNRVMTVYERQNAGDDRLAALGNFSDWQRQSRSFEDLTTLLGANMSLTGAGDAAHVIADYTTPAFFRVLRTNALMGRVFDESETQSGKDNVAVLGYAFWKSHFASDPSIVCRSIELDQRKYTVIGVLPQTMQYPSVADFFLPFAPTSAQLADRGTHQYLVVGRLRHGASAQDAQAELTVVANRLAGQFPATNKGWTVSVSSLVAGINGDYTPLYFNLIMAATLFLLLVVCANVANLQFARGIARRPEIAMRTALGATRTRLVRQLLTESLVLGSAGSTIGLVFGFIYMRLNAIAMPEKVARYMAGWSNISLNSHSVAVAVALALGSGIVSGLYPAFQALRVNLVDQLKSGSRAVAGPARGRWLRNVFAVAQISLAVALIAGAALMSKGMSVLVQSTGQYDPEHKLVFQVHLPESRYDTPQKQAAWNTQTLEKLQALPGVIHAATTSALPASDQPWIDTLQIENRALAPGEAQTAVRMRVSPSYFAAFNIPVVSGRLLNASDELNTTPVAVVSREFAARYFPGEDPSTLVGRRIRLGTGKDQTPWLNIVGVAGATNYFTFLREQSNAVYMSAAQLPELDMTYAVTTAGDPMAAALAIRKTLANVDPALPLDNLETFAQYRHEQIVGLLYVAVLLGVNAVIALLLAAIGIFGVMANVVGERTREIGVRTAMGAHPGDVLRMMLRRAGILTGVGLGIGLVLAFALARAVANLIYGVSASDPAVFGSIAVAIAAVAFVASWLPARRAAGIDPIVALRDQ